ncbi:unnamed protein product [Cuscuta epithymum]|uniref:Ubiquitin-like protease family profile domain-containing protein n=1 Tax=Cuscuta epithymum TaxID=186058 RepID=A0AAV0F6J4_9ASTE|nr:unnamed protein product [Cuscuta epithymum]
MIAIHEPERVTLPTHTEHEEAVTIYNGMDSVVVVDVTDDQEHMPKRKAVQPCRYTPGSDAIKKNKKTITMPNAFPISADPFAGFKSISERVNFQKFIMQGIAKDHRENTNGAKYSPATDANFYLDLDPGMEIESKTWLYKLYQSGQCLDSTHIIVIMFYLRMKAASLNYTQKLSTAEPTFASHLNTLFDAYATGFTNPTKSAYDGFFEDNVDGDPTMYLLPCGDCGVFLLKLAELLQMGINISSLLPMKIPDYRAKWAHDLFTYGSERARRKYI